MTDGKPASLPGAALDADFERLADAVRGGATTAMELFGETVSVWQKARAEPVSEADIAVNRHLHDRLLADRPDDGWLSEEEDEVAGAAGSPRRVWIVDPIDGTRSYLRGEPDFAVSVALAIDGRPELAAVAAPASKDLYLARRGDGAFLNGTRIRVAQRTRLEGCRMGADEAFFRARKHWPVPWPEMDYRRLGSIALRLAHVAAGKLDAAVSLRPKSHWDLAAAHLLVEEAGGACVDESGVPLHYGARPPVQPCFAASPTALLDPIFKRMRPALARRRGRKGRG